MPGIKKGEWEECNCSISQEKNYPKPKKQLKTDTYNGIKFIVKEMGLNNYRHPKPKTTIFVGVMETYTHTAGITHMNANIALEAGHFAFLALRYKPGKTWTSWSGSQGDTKICIDENDHKNEIGDKDKCGRKSPRTWKLYHRGTATAVQSHAKKKNNREHRWRQTRNEQAGDLLTESGSYNTTIRLFRVPQKDTTGCENRLNVEEIEKKITKYGHVVLGTHSCVSSTDLMVNYILYNKWSTALKHKGWWNSTFASYRNAAFGLIGNVFNTLSCGLGSNYAWTVTKTFSGITSKTWTS